MNIPFLVIIKIRFPPPRINIDIIAKIPAKSTLDGLKYFNLHDFSTVYYEKATNETIKYS